MYLSFRFILFLNILIISIYLVKCTNFFQTKYRRFQLPEILTTYEDDLEYNLDDDPDFEHIPVSKPVYNLNVIKTKSNNEYNPSLLLKTPNLFPKHGQPKFYPSKKSFFSNSVQNKQSVYDISPGMFSQISYSGPQIKAKLNHYDLYKTYLSSNNFNDYSRQCTQFYGQSKFISLQDLNNSFNYALNQVLEYMKSEKQNINLGIYQNVTGEFSSSTRHQITSYILKHSSDSFKEKEALLMEFATKFLFKFKCLNKFDVHFLLPSIKIPKRPLKDYTCNNAHSHNAGQKSMDCSKAVFSRYRNIDGSCNNLNHPYWGKASVCHLRLVASAYEDGISEPRSNSFIYGKKLPHVRSISLFAHYESSNRNYYSNLVMSFGQFFNHDITFTPTSQPEIEGKIINCCKFNNFSKASHPQCYPIKLSENDYQNIKLKKNCFNFVRSAPCPLCSLGSREQMNSVTSFLDLSTTYSSSKKSLKKLRFYKNGLLKVSNNRFGNIMMPKSENINSDQCSSKQNNHFCFSGGDVRANQHPALQLMHTLFVRNHNFHAKALFQENPKLTDEQLFQEARRLNIAEYQNIIYEEYLPLLFGPTLTSYFNLNTDSNFFYNKYDFRSKLEHIMQNLYTNYEPLTDPTTWNEYSTAACRYGHSQITSYFNLYGGLGYNGKNYTRSIDKQEGEGFYLKNEFFSSTLLHEGYYDSIIKGLITDRSMLVDPYFSTHIKNFLYKSKNEASGSDLISINLQRGRDHALAPYHVYVQFCFGDRIQTWEDLSRYIPHENIQVLRSLYEHVFDIDLYTGGLYEKKFPDASFGPTFACILGIQYYHLKFGDRYFYSHSGQAASFTPDQLINIKLSSSMANLICKTSDFIKSVQKNPFLPPSKFNSLVSCKSLPSLNYKIFAYLL